MVKWKNLTLYVKCTLGSPWRFQTGELGLKKQNFVTAASIWARTYTTDRQEAKRGAGWLMQHGFGFQARHGLCAFKCKFSVLKCAAWQLYSCWKLVVVVVPSTAAAVAKVSSTKIQHGSRSWRKSCNSTGARFELLRTNICFFNCYFLKYNEPNVTL